MTNLFLSFLNPEWHPLDPMVDWGEFKTTDFQLAYQYLKRLDAEVNLDGYTYKDTSDADVSPEAFNSFVDTLLK